MKFVGASVETEQTTREWMIAIHPPAVAFEVGE